MYAGAPDSLLFRQAAVSINPPAMAKRVRRGDPFIDLSTLVES